MRFLLSTHLNLPNKFGSYFNTTGILVTSSSAWSNTAFMERENIEDYHALQAYFNQRLQKILAKHGKKMMGWDEIIHPNLAKDVMVQSWRGHNSLYEAARQGNPTILSAGLYLDYKLPAADHYSINPDVLPGAITIEPDSLNWQNWQVSLQIGESPIEGTMTLYGKKENLSAVEYKFDYHKLHKLRRVAQIEFNLLKTKYLKNLFVTHGHKMTVTSLDLLGSYFLVLTY